MTCVLPEKVSLGLGTCVQNVSGGVLRGWIMLPNDIQKVVEWVGIEYREETEKHLGDHFRVTTKLSLWVSNVAIKLETYFVVDDFHGTVEAREMRIASDFRRVTLELIKSMAETTKADSERIALLLA
jgi:hypothetical protein